MFPNIRQRLILLAASLLGGWLLTYGGASFTAMDGGSGYSLWYASGGLMWSIVMLLLWSLPAVFMGVAASVGGHTLSGLFVVAAGWLLLAGDGGAMDGWLLRADLPGEYRSLIFESIIWVVIVAGLALAMQIGRERLRTVFPKLSADDHYGPDMRLGIPNGAALGAGFTCAAVAAAASYFLLRSSDSGQVIGGLLIAFALGGLAAQMLFPKNRNVIVVLVAPMLVAMGFYGYVLWTYQRPEQVLGAWYRLKLMGPALAMPMHYVGAGLAGVILGIGWGQSLQDSSEQGQTSTVQSTSSGVESSSPSAPPTASA